jgi:hypothetical protein
MRRQVEKDKLFQVNGKRNHGLSQNKAQSDSR